MEVGELPKAFVVRKADASLTEKDVEIFVDENVAPYKKLRGGVEFIDEIPKSLSGKILRRELKDRLHQMAQVEKPTSRRRSFRKSVRVNDKKEVNGNSEGMPRNVAKSSCCVLV